MSNIGRKIYYDLENGNVLVDCGEKSGSVVETTLAQDFKTYEALQGLVQCTVGMIQLEYGQFAEKFTLYPYHINITQNPINGIIWDTDNPYGATLDDIKSLKIEQINKDCNAEILAGFDSNAKDGVAIYHYGFSLEDQLNLESLKNNIRDGVFPDGIEYYYTGQLVCDIYTGEQFIKLYLDGMQFKFARIKKYKALKKMVLDCLTESEVNLISWDFPIPTV